MDDLSKKRGAWGSRIGFLITTWFAAIGIGNMWRFPFRCAMNGGGAFLVPYLLFILTVLDAYVNRTCTVVELCAHWQIAVSTLYAWIKRYKEHYDAWARSIDNPLSSQDSVPSSGPGLALRKAMGSSLSVIRADLPEHINAFFRRFGFSFLQPNRKTHLRELSGKRRARI